MAYNDCVAATLAAAIVAGSCAGVSVQKRGANVGRATGSRQCDGARVEEMTLANQEVALRVRSLVRSPREGFARIEIVATNLTGRLLWLNAKPSALVTGLPQEQQLFVTAEVPRKHLGRSRTYDVVTASSDSYAVLGPHEDRVIAAMIDTLNRIAPWRFLY